MSTWDSKFFSQIFSQTMREGFIECLASSLDIKAGQSKAEQKVRHDVALAEVLFSAYFCVESRVKTPETMLIQLRSFRVDHVHKGYCREFIIAELNRHKKIWRAEAEGALTSNAWQE